MANYWFLNDLFRDELVYQQLLNMNYRFVVGMDIGHGESLFYLLKKSIQVNKEGKTVQKFDYTKLAINEQGVYRIPTMIGFDGDKVSLGSDARMCPVYYQHFKTEPEKWELRNRVDKTATNRHLMKTFIQEAWKGICWNEQNKELAEALQNQQVLIAVGCPSSHKWTNAQAMQAYQHLIQKATGYDHVVVLAESTAAIMSALLLPGNRPRLSRGMAVVDAGSSTIDFTYVLLGKKLITASLDVAGYQLDTQILKVALEENGMTWDQLPAEQIPEILIQIRLMKERFYPKGKALEPHFISIWGRDDQGNISKEIHGGFLKITPTEAFMERAMNRKGIARSLFEPQKSWLEHCDGFIRDCRAMIPVDSEGKMFCDRVIVTGGTSYVMPFYDLVKANYPKGIVAESAERAASVAQGLCYAKCLEIRGRELVLGDGKPDNQTKVAGYKKEVEKLAQETYEAFMLSLAGYLSDAVIGDIQEVVDEYAKKNKKITAGWLLFWIKDRVEKDPKVMGDPCKATVKQLFEKQLQETMQNVKDKVNAVSQSIYGTQLGAVPQISELTQADFADMVADLDIAGVMNDTWLSSIVSCVNFAAITNTLFFVGCALLATPLMPLGLVLLGMCALSLFDEVQKKVMDFIVSNDTQVPPKVLKKMQENFASEEERQKMLSRSVNKTQKILLKGEILKKEFVSGIQSQAEAMLGKVLFLVYDEKPEEK